MAMNVGQERADDLVSAINTTPLVDVMLVLLIIFLITIPVATHTVPITLPKLNNQPRETAPENVNLSVAGDGALYWNGEPVAGLEALLARFKGISQSEPQPAIHIHGDAAASYEPVGRVVLAAQRAGIRRLSFITEPQGKQ
ncbi:MULTISPECIES: ExbD/TolR family protein [Brenneria]|uniref:Biopolymer transporter ExbD n=1 Tax=Brenneria nigrifluens DSM 30175 = ATCC 13028 TaxID=1121120 RepID=A0A2U1URD8_9GAMM|nr:MULTISPECIES: biopolymer transporter ExbD [Brenneria]EHD23149.1 Biopolymer transport protein ExbD/TolR [Brenneria sp. EniD312]PWC24240.1 biopolymer transporter ExbD [Brenneria nigrifluens DSM 30175 = ATCC 13028]QCR06031.1 biopolymer transporter ExbD [Brenneria nigrifluens DSM 30175 = ATCC 13028]